MMKTLKETANKVLRDTTNQLMRDANGKFLIEYSFMAGTSANLTFDELGRMIIEQDGKTIRCRAANYPKYFGGKTPSANTMMKWEMDGYCKTVTGYKTEPDGYGPDGSPSWMLALGLI